jgi:hypothetical protein
MLNNRPAQRPLNNSPVKEQKEAAAIARGPLTRRQHTLARNRENNEQSSFLLSLNEDVLSHTLSFLPARDLAVLETACTHFRFGSWLAGNKDAMTETTAKRKLDHHDLGDLGLFLPGFRWVWLFGSGKVKRVAMP